MSSLTARSLSMALVGGVAAAVFFSQGLIVWAALVAWAAFLDAGGDTPALKQTIVGNLFGASMAWFALVAMRVIQVPEDSWLWIPRAGGAVAVTLAILVLATRIRVLSRVSTSLYGYAAVFGAITVVIENANWLDRLTSLRFQNPFIAVVISMIAGALAGMVANRLSDALTRESDAA